MGRHSSRVSDVAITGPQGPKGDTGDVGAQGEQGIQGVPGTAASLADAYPVNTLFFNTTATNPNTLLGFGTWTEVGIGGNLTIGISVIAVHCWERTA